jgi:hypothetical protein
MVSGQRVSSMRRAQRVAQSASSMRTRSSSGVPSHLSPPPFTSSFSSLSSSICSAAVHETWDGFTYSVCGAAAREGAAAPGGRSSVWRGRAASGKGGVGLLRRGTLPARERAAAVACRNFILPAQQHPIFDSVRPKSFTYSVSL